MLRGASAALLVASVACVSGCAEDKKLLPRSVRTFLREADHLELLSLDPANRGPDAVTTRTSMSRAGFTAGPSSGD
jgi:hypothetical protein